MTYKHKNKYKESFDFDNIKANHLIEVEYAPYYKITTKIDHGTIVDDILNISSGENKKVKWKPAEGYYVSKIIVDNVPKTGVINNIEQYLSLVMGIISMVIITLIMINRSLHFRKYNK